MSETKRFENVTLFFQGEFGFSFNRKLCKWVEIETGVRWAQYENATRVTFLEKGKRKPREFVSYTFAGRGGVHLPHVVLSGFHPDFSPSMYVGGYEVGNGVVTSVSRYSSCDARWGRDFDAALAKYAGEVGAEVVHDNRHALPLAVAV